MARNAAEPFGNRAALDPSLDPSALRVPFSDKPLAMGGLAMEHYGLRRRGGDVDFIVSGRDYDALAARYPDHRKDVWGDLGVKVGAIELFRSVFRLDYDYYAEGSADCGFCLMPSLGRLFFMKAIAYGNRPDVPKHAEDFRLVMGAVIGRRENAEYAANAAKHLKAYLAAPEGTIPRGEYEIWENASGETGRGVC